VPQATQLGDSAVLLSELSICGIYRLVQEVIEATSVNCLKNRLDMYWSGQIRAFQDLDLFSSTAKQVKIASKLED
jgi:hypothetical protein